MRYGVHNREFAARASHSRHKGAERPTSGIGLQHNLLMPLRLMRTSQRAVLAAGIMYLHGLHGSSTCECEAGRTVFPSDGPTQLAGGLHRVSGVEHAESAPRVHCYQLDALPRTTPRRASGCRDVQ